MEYHLGIKDLPLELRPRERMLASGPGAMSNAELVAILLRTGSRGQSALDLAVILVARPDGLANLARIPLTDLIGYHGIGHAKACQLVAAFELGRRVALSNPAQRFQIRSPADVAHLVMEEMRTLDREHFRSLTLNTKNRVLAVHTVAIGGLNYSLIHPREVFKDAIRDSAAGVILVHNHPSGDSKPSNDDVSVTKRMIEAGKILGVEVLDHIVIGDGSYCSLKEENLF